MSRAGDDAVGTARLRGRSDEESGATSRAPATMQGYRLPVDEETRPSLVRETRRPGRRSSMLSARKTN